MKDIAVIILNYKDSDNSIRITKKFEKMVTINRIILVDNLSPDNSFEKFKKLKSDKVDVIQTNINNGYSSGNNFGINYLNDKYGEFQYIIISNPDVDVNESAIKKCKKYLEEHDNFAIAAPKMIMKNDKEHPLSGWKLRTILGDIHDSSLFITKIINKPHIEMYEEEYMNGKEIVVDCVAGSFFVIRNSIFKKIGYFDEKTFLYFEEDILGKKIHDLGMKNVILNDCNFKHFESVSVDRSMNYIRKYKNLQKSKIYYHKKYNRSCFLMLFLLRVITLFVTINFYFRKFINNIMELFFKLYKFIILALIVITLPISKLKQKNKLLYFSVVNWKWIKQRPHFVPLFLSNNNYKVTYLYEEPYKKYINNNVNDIVSNEKNDDNLKIKAWRFTPYNYKKSKFNRFIFVTRMLFMDYEKIVFTGPKQVSNFFMTALKLKGTKFYYECMDNYAYWENDKTIDFFQGRESYLVSVATKIIVSSSGLKNLLIKKYNCSAEKIEIIRNGYDRAAFSNIVKSPIRLKHPCATYIGTIDDWFDFDSIIKYATKNPNVMINIIGPIGMSVKDKIKSIKNKNIIFYAPIEHKYVPDTIKQSDVMLLPFDVNELIEDVDPVKVYEYLFMRKNVVSSYWKELNQFKNFCIFYDLKKNDFEKAMKKAFNSKLKINSEYDKLMLESSWDERLKKYLEVINEE